jgi:HK97 family phage portal protein
MSLIDNLAHLFLDGIGPIQTRAMDEYPSYEEQMQAIWNRHQRRRPWRSASVGEALGVPAIFSAVSLISDTVGSLSLEAFRQGSLLNSDQTPRLVQRPNPFSTPRAFFRDTAYYLATRGEAWWWIARRDIDGVPMSLYPIPPWEITVVKNDRNRLRPIIEWANKRIDNDDLRQITYLPSDDGLRGVGPLQVCGAAASVTVEAQEWAANFFSGSIPSIIGTTDQEMTEDELKEMDKQWNEKPPNMPRWLTNGLTMSESPVDPQKAQLTESRQHQVGESARMFNMPGALIEYQMGGSSLTYQNQEDIWQDFQRRCLSPHYLEPIEQEISDLLTRSTVARFNLKQLLRAAPKTRMEVHQIAIEAGIYGAEVAAQEEGYLPGSVDFASVPPALPQAVPNLLPVNLTRASEVRCPKGHLLAELASPPYRFTCFRCKSQVAA